MYRIIMAMLVTLFVLACASNQNQPGTTNLQIDLRPYSPSEPDTLSATAFGVSLAAWVSENDPSAYTIKGEYHPSLQALVGAITSQVTIWKELQENKSADSTYMTELLNVADNDFLNDYVWVYHIAGNDIQPPQELNLSAFNAWAQRNLRNHLPRIEAVLIFEPST